MPAALVDLAFLGRFAHVSLRYSLQNRHTVLLIEDIYLTNCLTVERGGGGGGGGQNYVGKISIISAATITVAKIDTVTYM